MSEPWYRVLPQWYQDGSPRPATGMAAGQQGPDYSTPEPPQPGEGPGLLPTFEGSPPEVQKQNRIKNRKEPQGQVRRPPYFPIFKPLTYSTNAGAVNIVELGRPNPGYRWVLKQIAILPGDTIANVTGGGVFAHFFIGNMPPNGTPPAMSEWLQSIATFSGSPPINSVVYTSSFHIQNTQSLLCYLTGGVNGALYLPFARVEQITDRRVEQETDTG